MPRNTMNDLIDHLFEQLERLNDEDLKGDELKDEIERSRAVSGLAQQVVATANVSLKAAEFQDMAGKPAPFRLSGGSQ